MVQKEVRDLIDQKFDAIERRTQVMLARREEIGRTLRELKHRLRILQRMAVH